MQFVSQPQLLMIRTWTMMAGWHVFAATCDNDDSTQPAQIDREQKKVGDGWQKKWQEKNNQK